MNLFNIFRSNLIFEFSFTPAPCFPTDFAGGVNGEHPAGVKEGKHKLCKQDNLPIRNIGKISIFRFTDVGGDRERLSILKKTFCRLFEEQKRPGICSRMRSGWVKGSLMVFVVASALVYLSSIKTEFHSHSERLQRAQHDDSIRGQGMIRRMDRMEEDISRLRESTSLRSEWI